MDHSFDSVVRQGLLDYAARHGRIDNPYSVHLNQSHHERWDAGWSRGFDLEAVTHLRQQLIGLGDIEMFLMGRAIEVRAGSETMLTQKFSSAKAAVRYGNELLWVHQSVMPSYLSMPMRGLCRLLSRFSTRIQRRFRQRCVCSCSLQMAVFYCKRHGNNRL